MTEDIQMPNGDFLKNYPGVTRVEVTLILDESLFVMGALLFR